MGAVSSCSQSDMRVCSGDCAAADVAVANVCSGDWEPPLTQRSLGLGGAEAEGQHELDVYLPLGATAGTREYSQSALVTVPVGMRGGQPLTVQMPAGPTQVQIPPGLRPGQTFRVAVPPRPLVRPGVFSPSQRVTPPRPEVFFPAQRLTPKRPEGFSPWDNAIDELAAV